MYEYRAQLVRVIDGDTVDLAIDLGFDVWIKERVRLMGVNTPESRTRDLKEKKEGLAAKAYVEKFLDVEVPIYITTEKEGKGKFGRILGDLVVGEESLTANLIADGHAIPYDGGKRGNWFEMKQEYLESLK